MTSGIVVDKYGDDDINSDKADERWEVRLSTKGKHRFPSVHRS